MMHQYRWKQRCQSGAEIVNNQKGAAVLVSVIFIAAVLLVIALSLGANSISRNEISLYQSQAYKLFINSDGCAEEALIRLSMDRDYAGETIAIDGTSCVIDVAGFGNSRTISIGATKTNYSKDLQIDVTLSPELAISSWQEISN